MQLTGQRRRPEEPVETAVGGEEQEACGPSGSEQKEPRVGTVSRWHRAPEAPRQAGLAQPHLTSLSPERQGSCLLLSPQYTAEVRSWFTHGPEAQAAVTESHRLGGLDNRTLLSHGLEAGSPSSGCQQVWLLLRPPLGLLMAVFSLSLQSHLPVLLLSVCPDILL